jgi:hypothetical protein
MTHTTTLRDLDEDTTTYPRKRQRLGFLGLDEQKAHRVPLLDGLARSTDIGTSTQGEISEETIVCFGMVGVSMAKAATLAHLSRSSTAL